jgi:hypothetical protein
LGDLKNIQNTCIFVVAHEIKELKTITKSVEEKPRHCDSELFFIRKKIPLQM